MKLPLLVVPTLVFAIGLFAAPPPPPVGNGAIRGKITLAANGDPVHGATVTVSRTGRTAVSNDDGVYEVTGLAPGSYQVVVHLQSLTDQSKIVDVASDGTPATADFSLQLAAVKETLTVTANGNEQTTFESFQTVTSLDGVDLALNSKPSLGEVLEFQPGVAKRSFGPGTSRPVIRGFDGDRVLVMQDGLPTGTLSSQSGDHGESIEAVTLERLEVVKGPATLLYGSNAIGGVVNAVTGHHLRQDKPQDGLQGFLATSAGTTNAQASGAGGFNLGIGNWNIWGSGSGQRTGDYNTPEGKILNSSTRGTNTTGGFGWFGAKTFFDMGYRYEEGSYGVPFAGEFEAHGHEGEDHADEEEAPANIRLAFRRHNVRGTLGWKNADNFLEGFRLSLNYSDWRHGELENGEEATVFRNRQGTYRGVFNQRRVGRVTGSFGFQGAHRDYKTIGAEALAPPVRQDNIAVFGLEEVQFERVRFQFGGRVENTRYKPMGLPNRSFTGFSGGAGINVPITVNTAFVANYTHSFRAPALEELYNNGPHVGNVTYEIGNPNLVSERSNGVDLAFRRQTSRMRAEANFFHYRLQNFVYLAPTGEEEDGLPKAQYSQAGSRFTGTELSLDLALVRSLWLNLGSDYVHAELVSGPPVPRIPPFRGRVGFDYRKGGLSIKPFVRLANQQDRLFPTETRTAGYAVFNIMGSYTITRKHMVHIFGVDAFNLNDRLYRNHLSFIKDRAPEIGRGIRFSYTMRFF